MQQFWNFLKHLPPQMITVILLFGVPTVARILKKLGEQSQKRAAGIRRAKEQEELLRTGRIEKPQAEAAPSARATLEEMAAKRRAQIEELRQRRQAQMAGAQAPKASQATMPSAPTMRQRPATQSRQAPADRRPAQAPARTPARSSTPQPSQQQRDRVRQQAQARQNADQERQRREQESQRRTKGQQRDRAPKIAQQEVLAAVIASKTPELTAEAKRDVAATTSVARPEHRKLVLVRGDWRKAFIMQEVLAPPLSMR